MTNFVAQLKPIAGAILSSSRQEDFNGYDLLDGLNSKLFDLMLSLKRGILGLAWIQLFNQGSL